MTPSSRKRPSEVVAERMDNFAMWLVSNPNNPLWASRSPGEEAARVALSTLAGWLREADQVCQAVECRHRTEWECLADILDPPSVEKGSSDRDGAPPC